MVVAGQPAGRVALVIVIVAETGRLPVDNPSTHLELTMVHEAMVLEYAGPRPGAGRVGAAMRLTVLLGLLANLFVPWGIAAAARRRWRRDRRRRVRGQGRRAGGGAGRAEVFLAKLRLFRVPELLAGSFVLALLAVTAAFFFTVAAMRTAVTEAIYASCSTSPPAGSLLAAVLVLWRRELRAIVRLFALQGVALAAIPSCAGCTRTMRALLVVGAAVLASARRGAAVAAGAARWPGRAAAQRETRHWSTSPPRCWPPRG